MTHRDDHTATGNGSVPLQLIVTPDEYLCTWMLESAAAGVTEFPGSLNLRAGEQPTGVMHGDLPIEAETHADGVSVAEFPQKVHVATLRANLANGMTALLVDAQIEYWMPGRGDVIAAAAVVGVFPASAGATVEFSRLKLQVGGLEAVAGVRPLSRKSIPGAPRHLEGIWSAEGNPDSSLEWSDETVRVEFSYDVSTNIGDWYSFHLSSSPVLRVTSEESLPLRRWIDDWVNPVRHVLSVATGVPQPLTYLAVAQGDEEGQSSGWAQVFGSGIEQTPFQSSEEQVRKARTALMLARDGTSLLDLVRCWRRLEKDRHPMVETYGSMIMVKGQHPRSRFLLLVQALEGSYGHDTKAEWAESKARHHDYRQPLLAKLKENQFLDKPQAEFAKKFLSRNPYRNLETVLRRTFEKLPINSIIELRALPLVQAEMAETQKTDPLQAVAQIRNNLAHGTKGYDPQELHQAVRVLERAVRARALGLLGCSKEVQARALSPSP